MGRQRFSKFLGLGLIVIAVVAVAFVVMTRTPAGSVDRTAHVKGLIGSSKVGLMQNERITRILREKYNLTVDFKSGSTGDMLKVDPATVDFIWPASQWALEQYRDLKKPEVKSSKLLNTPLVIYSWDEVTAGLVRDGLVKEVPLRSLGVEREGAAYFLNDQARLIDDITGGKPWKDLGLDKIFGKMAVTPTDPCQSNSGQMFMAMTATTLAGKSEPPGPEDTQRLTPSIVSYYKRLGILQASSAPMFQQFLVLGMGSFPMVVDYESLMVEFYLQHPSYQELLRKRIRIIYPGPTSWAEHVFIATDSSGAKLLDALQDKEIQETAWGEHGFRTGLPDLQNRPEVLQITGIPPTIDNVVQLPAWKTISPLIDAYCKAA